MNKSYWLDFLDAILKFLHTIHRGILFLMLVVFFARNRGEHIEIEWLGRYFSLVIFVQIIAFCTFQAISTQRPMILDLDQVLDDFKLEIESSILVECENPKDNGKYAEHNFMSRNHDNNIVFATLITRRKTGQVVELIYSSYQGSDRVAARFGPPFGVRPNILIGKINTETDLSPIYIEEELAKIFVRALRAADAQNIGELGVASRAYLYSCCYGAIPYSKLTTLRTAKKKYPTTHNLEYYSRDEKIKRTPLWRPFSCAFRD